VVNAEHLTAVRTGALGALSIQWMTRKTGVGLAIYDLFVAQALYREALRRNIGVPVDL
jgi:ornithine cyclodeaminase/alanine dehydrogenase-like protein (mu-crystallin family)